MNIYNEATLKEYKEFRDLIEEDYKKLTSLLNNPTTLNIPRARMLFPTDLEIHTWLFDHNIVAKNEYIFQIP